VCVTERERENAMPDFALIVPVCVTMLAAGRGAENARPGREPTVAK
jgi:hypothetical protein